MKKLLVGTVCGPGKWTKDFLHLQHKFLRATTQNYDHVVVQNDVNVSDECRQMKIKVVDTNIGNPDATNAGHAVGLRSLLKFYKEKIGLYEYFLFLDSDAWPIRKDWMECILNKMDTWLSRRKVQRQIAVAIRPENLETRLHTSILFCRPCALSNIQFEVAAKGNLTDLAGNVEKDVWIGDYYQKTPQLVMPLLRTNKENIHPLWSGIYYDCFYHHGGGTHQGQGRSFLYYHHMIGTPNKNKRFDKLKNGPSEFISQLAGWSPDKYVKPQEIK